MTQFQVKMSALLSECGTYRYLLERIVAETGITIVYAGVNPSKASGLIEDSTTKKWNEFTRRAGGRRYIAVNPLAYRATDVKELRAASDPRGPDNERHIREAIAQADLLVPCWGDRAKLPRHLRHHLQDLWDMMVASGKPMAVFGYTQAGDPKHPLMLGYSTELQRLNGA